MFFILLSPGCGGGGSSFNDLVKGYDAGFCGDGVIQTGEICDDGNITGGDGCSAKCQPEINQISAGQFHTCGLTPAGGVKCWGDNRFGQLGDRTTTRRYEPTDVAGLSSGVVAISTGGGHACALTTAGAVKCWGDNRYGQLGDGTTMRRYEPTDVMGLTGGVAAISAGDYHTCALTTAGAVKCWGENGSGQIGDGTTTDRYEPTDLTGFTSGVAAISAGYEHTCALTKAGTVKCWGDNRFGQLGDGTKNSRYEPTDVPELTGGAAAISAGTLHTCALTSTGGVKCWGSNGSGQLGDGTTNSRYEPMNVPGLTDGVAAISAGTFHTCALTSTGGVKCWGSNDYGQLGDGMTIDSHEPMDVPGLADGVAAISTGYEYTCALMSAGGAKCWGSNDYGQLGDASTAYRNEPTDISELTGGVAAISASYGHTCALTSTGGVKCWGSNDSGQLGGETTESWFQPRDVVGLTSGVAAISVGYQHTCALTMAGAMKCWGNNSSGQLGDGTVAYRYEPTDVSGLTSGVAAISAGYNHTCALTTAGSVKCWGENSSGQLGDGTTTFRYEPTDVSGLSSGVAAISAGNDHTCALTTAGGVKCWGENSSGQLGDGSTTARYEPTDVSGLTSGVAAISTRSGHTCAVTTAGFVKCWGENYYGELGDGTTTSRYEPTDVSEQTVGVAAISAGSGHTCAVTTTGGVKCWGENSSGQLGDGTTTPRNEPTDVPGLIGGVASISTGSSHTCAVTTADNMKCWGWNAYGQLGVDPGWTPVDVVGF